jgi:LacI family transcriptional regulator/LacI family repressor for deo operon, udp, cdd, tsx, nupC, and nupG
MRRNLSIQDIAQAAGVSHTTVSRALRDSPLISLEVRQRVQRIAEEMGYIPNAVAQSLRGARTNTIGLVVTTIADPFVGRVVRGIEEAAQEKNLSLFLSVSNNDPEREIAVIETFRRRRVDGIIVTAARLTPHHEKRLVSASLPTVLINPQAERPPEQLHSVSFDDASGAQLAMRHLLDLGHRAIGYLGAANRPRSNRERLRGYLDALAAAGISPRPEGQRTAPPERRYHTDDVGDGQTMLPALVAAGVTAIFCCNDMMAIGALTACRALGIAVPEQLSLVGFDDVEMAQFVTPPLTTIHQPRLRLGQMAMTMLLDLLSGTPVSSAVLPAALVERGSTAPPPPVPARDLLPADGAGIKKRYQPPAEPGPRSP